MTVISVDLSNRPYDIHVRAGLLADVGAVLTPYARNGRMLVVTDENVAPAGMENLFILIPIPAGLEDTAEIKETYFKKVISRIEKYCGESIHDSIVVKRSYAGSDFITDYNAFKGNAYGLANTLMQTAFLRPKIRSRKLKNLYFTQL